MSIEKLKEQARRQEQNEEWSKALDLYLQAVELAEKAEDVDISLYNRVGDLQIRVGDQDGAVATYERGIDLYLEAELPNNAIAICQKIIRNAPGRPEPYLRMGQIQADQGFGVDARDNFLTYAEMQQGKGNTDEAVRAIGEFVQRMPEAVDTRLFLAEQLVSMERDEEAIPHFQSAYQRLVKAGEGERAEQVKARLEEVAPGVPIPTEPIEDEMPAEVGGPGGDALEDDALGLETTSLAMEGAMEEEAGEGPDEEEEAEPLPTLDMEDEGEEEPAAEAGDEMDLGEISLETTETFEGASDEDAEDEDEDAEDEEAEPLPTMEFDEEAGDEEEAEPLSTMEWDEEDGDDEEGEPLPTMEWDDGDEEVGVEAEETGDEGFGDLGELDLEEEPAEAADETADEVMEEAFEEARAEAPAPTEDEEASRLREALAQDPDRVDLHQQLVERAHETNDRPLLLEAFLGLARTLSRTGDDSRARAVYQQVLDLEPDHPEARRAVEEGEAASEEAAAPAGGEDYVDLGSMILDEPEGEKTTRWKVAAEDPSGDEEADFARMLSQFKEKVAENLPTDDFSARYDLGAAYKEMGLVDEAITEFQGALRIDSQSLAALEMLGRCFLDKGEPQAAVRTLERALKLPYRVEDDLLGIYYYLGQGHEQAGESDAAKEYYEKVFSLDINFMDVTERLRTLR